jgi:3-oxoacyl-[acyl-carrier-protein] synthase-3
MLYLHGMGHFHPENVVDNDFLESLDIGTDDAWIIERVGIESRRTVLPLDYIRATRNADPRAAAEAALFDNAETGARAARLAMERAGVGPEQIGLVLAGGCSPDYAIPAEAARIAARLGIAAPALDLASACSSFGAQVHFCAQMGATLPEYVLVVQPENNTRVVDYRESRQLRPLGDGTAAAVLSARVPARLRVDLTSFDSNPRRLGQGGRPAHRSLHPGRPRGADLRHQDHPRPGGRHPRARRRAQPAHAHRPPGNLLMLQAVRRFTGIDEDRHFTNVVDFGNTGAAGAPSILSQRWDDWRDGDEIALAVVGSGLSWSAMRIRVGAGGAA